MTQYDSESTCLPNCCIARSLVEVVYAAFSYPLKRLNIEMSTVSSNSSRNILSMVTRRVIRFVSLCCLLIHIVGDGEACHTTYPYGDQTEEPFTCTVGSVPFGTFGPAPGSIVGDGAVAGLTCDPNYYASITPAVQTCNNGFLSPPIQCIEITCPDIAPLLLPGDPPAPPAIVYREWDPVATMPTYPVPVGSTLKLQCSAVGVVRVISGPFEYCQNAQNYLGLGEELAFTYVVDHIRPPE
uniref:Sushi domain-containing protein n=1 Tax=Plectus sambesii TaxID=2011161 RepID=A0A914WEN7_9BILA